jgi:hypothetical protein
MTDMPTERVVRNLGECGGRFSVVRNLGECGGRFSVVRNLGECGGHFWAPADEDPEDVTG